MTTTIPESDGLLAALTDAGNQRYEVHAKRHVMHGYFIVPADRAGTPPKWISEFDTGQHFPWRVVLTIESRNGSTHLRVAIDGEHWKEGSYEAFAFGFDLLTGKRVAP